MLTQHTKKPENKNIPGIQNLNPMWDIFLIVREPIPKYTILSINLIYRSLQPSITSYSMILSITYGTKSGKKPEMGNTKPERFEPGFNYTMPEFMVLIIEYPTHLYGEVILCLFIDITHDTNSYKNIINQATRIKI